MVKKNEDVVVGMPKLKEKEEGRLYVFPEGDPRNGLTAQEIVAMARQEEEDMERHISKFAAAQGVTDTDEKANEEEEEQVYSIDLENKLITTTEESVLIPVLKEEKPVIQAPALYPEESKEDVEAKRKFKEAQEMSNLVNDAFVRKAIRDLIVRIETAQEEIDKTINKLALPSITENAFQENDKLYKRVNELKACINFGGTTISYEKIPSWARADVRLYVQNRMNELIDLAE